MKRGNWLRVAAAVGLAPGILSAPARGFAQAIRSQVPADPAVDYARLTRIDTLVQQYVRSGWVEGVVTIIVKDDQLIQYKGYGYLNAESRTLMPRDALFRIASQTKAIVSAGIMILYEEGRFTLDEPISDFIPAFAHPRVLDKFNSGDTTYTTVPAKREITFRDLLTHTSGLDYPVIGSEDMKAIYAKAGISAGLDHLDMDLRKRMEALARLPLVHQPGEKWTYGLSVDVLGDLIEIMSGKDLESFLSDRILRPLGMKDTYFNVPAGKAGRLAALYTEDSLHHVVRWRKENGGAPSLSARPTEFDPDYPLVHKRYFSGGAGLTSTAYDYAVFLQMMLNHGRYKDTQVLAPRTVQLMTSGQLDSTFDGMDNFGLGFRITSERSAARQPKNTGSFSWGGYFGTTYWADPKDKLVCLIMTQQTPNSHGDLAEKFEQLVYQSIR